MSYIIRPTSTDSTVDTDPSTRCFYQDGALAYDDDINTFAEVKYYNFGDSGTDWFAQQIVNFDATAISVPKRLHFITEADGTIQIPDEEWTLILSYDIGAGWVDYVTFGGTGHYNKTENSIEIPLNVPDLDNVKVKSRIDAYRTFSGGDTTTVTAWIYEVWVVVDQPAGMGYSNV